MAITLPTNFQKLAAVNSGQTVVLVHLYKDASTYIAIASHPVVIGTVQYLACLINAGQISTEWKLTIDNGCTLGAPTVELQEYTTPNGYSLIEEFQTYNFAGKKLVILEGYAGTALADYITLFSGTIDAPVIDGDQIQLPCIVKEIPETEIAGGKIDVNGELIGTNSTNGTGIILPPDADGMRLPLPLGNHWNAPIICYDLQATVESRWATFDNYWWAGSYVDATLGHLRSAYRNNLNQSSKRILLEQEEMLVPFHALGYDNNTAFDEILDTRFYSLQCVRLKASASAPGTNLLDGSLWVEVPMRLKYSSNVGGTGHDSADAVANLVNVFDGDGDTSWQFQGTMSSGSGADSCYWDFVALLELDRNLRHDHLCIVHPTRPIHIPSADDEWTVVWFGKYAADPAPAGGYEYRQNVVLDATLVSPSQTAGQSVLFREGTGTLSYDYFSNVYQRDATGWHTFTVDDLVNLGLENGLCTAGDSNASDQENTLPFLRRNALDGDISFAIRFIIVKVGTYAASQVIGMRVYDLSYHAIETLPLDYGKPLYTDLQGITLNTSEDNLLTRASGATGDYQPYRPPQYLETVLRAKAGAVTADFHSTDWTTTTDANWTRFFSTARDYSGMVFTGELTLDQWLKDYVKEEPFSVYRDPSNLWRFLLMFKTLSDIQTYGTIHEVAFADCDTFEIGLTPFDNICAEIKSMETDYIYFSDDYAQKWHWKLPSTALPVAYNYAFYDAANTESTNHFFKEKLQKKYTSTPQQASAASRTTYGAGNYGALRTCRNRTPVSYPAYWRPLAGDDSGAWGTVDAYSSAVTYYGEDSENRACAEFYLNMWANRHRTIQFTSTQAEYRRFEVGDYLEFTGVPYSLLGLVVKGFAGEDTTESVAVNNQNVYYVFQVTKVVKKPGRSVEISCIQCHDLTAYKPVTGGVQSIA